MMLEKMYMVSERYRQHCHELSQKECIRRDQKEQRQQD